MIKILKLNFHRLIHDTKYIKGIRSPIFKHYTRTSSDPDDAHIVISGGGMVGSAMACALGKEKMLEEKKIVLLESSAKKTPKVPEVHGIRVCALSRSTADFLSRIGAWDYIQNMRFQPVTQMQVWESCSDSRITLNNDDLSEELAYIVENDVILAALTQCIDDMNDRIDVRYECKASSYKLAGAEQPFVDVYLDSGQSLRTKLLIGADGLSSKIRRAAGFHVMGWSYDQTAVVATLSITETENTIAWQRFLPTGPIALLPLTSTLSSLVWTCTNEEGKRLLSMPEEGFVDAVNDALFHERHKNTFAVQIGSAYNTLLQNLCPGPHFGRQLPPTIISMLPDSRATFPLSLAHSSQYVMDRLALIGDAAHRVHPLAGQGVNLGFGDVDELTRVLVETVHKGAEIGNVSDLMKYETARQRRNLQVMLTIDALHRLYSTHLTPVVLMRSLGLQTTNAATFLKNKIISQATSL